MTANDNSPIDGPGHVTRRRVLATGTGTLATAIAGCLSTGDDAEETDSATESDNTDDENGASPPEEADSEGAPQLPEVEDPPDAVYLPTHREAMVHLEPAEVGPYTVGPMLTYPHPFWLVTGTTVEEVRPEGPGVHLMFSVWDTETGQVLPVDVGAEMRTIRDGEVIDTRSPWPMISQSMGFHFGDNIELREEGTYTVEVDLNPITVRRTGKFAGRFETEETVSFEFEFDQEFQREVVEGVEFFDEERWGERGAVEPMGGMDHHEHGEGMSQNDGHDGHDDHSHDDHGHHEMPFSALPPAEEYPGERLGEPTSGDATFVVRYLDDTRLGDDGYLLVSPRTPYNRVPLADMALSVSGAVEGELVQTLDSELGHHYGMETMLSPGETFELDVESPPQVSRHRGYETAFIEMPSMTLEVPE